jgi:putative hemolysin
MKPDRFEEKEMTRKNWFVLSALCLLTILAACVNKTPVPTPVTLVDEDAQIANPASVYCGKYGGKLEIRTDASGGQMGICIFADGSECEEWAYFRGECAPASALQVTLTPVQPSTGPATPTPETAANGWKIYRDARTGLYFEYPPDATLEAVNGNPQDLSITGPGGWPSFLISFPSDREDFRPPEGTDLAQFLTDRYLMPENRQADAQIAGELAIHTRFERSQQAFADDRYFFAHNGQLFNILIGHQDDKEDWELYNRFLGSFKFTN